MDKKRNFSILPTASYNLIYVFAIPDENHKGLLKIGQTSLVSPLSEGELPANCDELAKAAHKRIKGETRTAKVNYELKHVELAVKHFEMADGTPRTENFTDKAVLKLLKRSHYRIVTFEESGRDSEWAEVDLVTAIRAIQAVKEDQVILHDDSLSEESSYVAPPKKIVLRKEQEDNVVKTIGIFETYDEMLWDCKMRYGKTVTAYELIRRKGYRRVIVITHRPAVSDGWREDHGKIFGDSGHVFEDRATGSSDGYNANLDANNTKKLHELIESRNPFVYFASIQDLRGSKCVGGKHPKNEFVFNIDWDLIVVDEAHEGTETDKGKAVVDGLRKNKSKILRLSGTPYNILDRHKENVYTWTYVDEQNAKRKWSAEHPNEENPYAMLPAMNILTFDLGEQLKDSYKYVTEDSAFNFREFFRVWTGNASRDFRPIPSGQHVGDFVHKSDVLAFLNLISCPSESSFYPFASEAFRDMFRHTFWIVPGVKEAAALSKLLDDHPIFHSFKVANVAGDGDVEQPYDKALKFVKETIANHPYTITLSCGKLTTGVTVPEWTGIMMLSGSAKTSLSGYMQAIFRVQSPGCINGKQKENCYVFDFAPDRTLRVVAEVHHITAKSNSSGDKDALGEFLNFCPIISVEGTVMRSLDVADMMLQIKRMSIDNVIQSGFEDDLIYKSDTGIVMDEVDAEILKKLSDVIAPQGKRGKNKEYVVNAHGMDQEEYEQAEKIKNKPKRQRTPLEQALLEKLGKQKAEQKKVLDLLRAVSIRLPLLFYGADADITEIIRLKDFVKLVDDESWEEFMPKGLKKDFFLQLLRFYDEDVLVGAGLRIRKISKSADELPPMLRAKKIVGLINSFKNPDKETVLTPWRVVNMHMGDCIGGYNFFNEGYTKAIEEPRLIEQPDGSGEVTADIFLNPDVKILEMNSKSGLYPLYMAYSIYKLRLDGNESSVPLEEAQRIWFETLRDNIFVLCKTEMAKLITVRTLAGYSREKVNAVYLPHLLERMRDKERFARKLRNPQTWGREGEIMKFDAVVGNPPYQLEGGSGGNNDSPIYQFFVDSATNLNPRYCSFVIPARWFAAGRENLLGNFRRSMIASKNIRNMHVFTNSNDLFPTVEIKGGICYFLRDLTFKGNCSYSIKLNDVVQVAERNLDDFDVLIRIPILSEIVKKVWRSSDPPNSSVDSIISNDTPFGISSNPKTSKKNSIQVFSSLSKEHDVALYHIENNKRKVEYVRKTDITKNTQAIGQNKVFIPGGYGAGENYPHQILGVPEYAAPNSVCSQSYLYASFNSEVEAQNFIKYLKTKFFRALVSSVKISQSAPNRVYRFVPMQDFSKVWTDQELYEKYGLSKEEIEFIEGMIKVME